MPTALRPFHVTGECVDKVWWGGAGEYLRGLGDPVPRLPPAPTLVLINSRSGGHAGPALTRALRRAVGQSQVHLTWLQRIRWHK